MITLCHLIAYTLDVLALLAVKVGLLRGAYVSYTPGKPWHFDAWKAGLQFGQTPANGLQRQ